jgi:hypothetical protein
VTKAEGKLLLFERAKRMQRIAELFAEVAQIEWAIAEGEPLDIGTGRKVRRDPEPEIPQPSEFDAAMARRALQTGRRARRVGR